MMFSGSFFVALAASFAAFHTQAAPLEDLVQSLPGFGRTPTPQFSGYLDATNGCDTDANGDECKLHYWFAMAETKDPMSAPVVLWLNGGPGSSSILGFLQENGPLLINATGGLMVNPWSWTKVANLLALEAPVGVGYSYCAKQTEGQVCKNTDKFTASASRAALVDFFQNKFPELADNDFFITGESYAGIYIPTLSKELLDHASDVVNLVGAAIGDPCTDNTAQEDSMDSLWYGFKYGLVDEAIFDLLWNHCQVRRPNLMNQGGVHLVAQELNKQLKEKKELGVTQQELKEYAQQWLDELSNDPGADFRKDDPRCTVAYYKYMLSTSRGLSQSWGDLYIDDYSLFAPVSSQEDLDMAAYMNRDDVREALHVQEAPTSSWPYPEVGFDYTKEFDACNSRAKEGALSMIDFYRNIVPRLRVTWVYNGDTDPCVSYEGTRTAVKRVGLPELDGGGYRPWFYNQSAAPLEVLVEKAPLFGPNLLIQGMGAQFGGEVVSYEKNLAFLTVHGSGHMVPQFRPQAALHMLDKLVHFEDLSPLMPSNATLRGMTKEQFQVVLDDWTESAMAPPYVTHHTTVAEEEERTVPELDRQQEHDVKSTSVGWGNTTNMGKQYNRASYPAPPAEYFQVHIQDFRIGLPSRSGIVDDTEAFNKAIRLIEQNGGGRLVVSGGLSNDRNFHIRPINLTNHMILLLDDVTIYGIPGKSLWPIIPPIPSYGQGRDHPGPRYTSLIHGEHLVNVTIQGTCQETSVIDGNGEYWWKMHIAGEDNFTRGHLIEFMYSHKIRIFNLTLRNSPFWTNHFFDCNDVHVQSNSVYAPQSGAPNTDGWDPDSSTNILIEDSEYYGGDDCVAIKSGWDCFGVDYGKPSSNITIRRLTCQGRSASISIGSEMSGGVKMFWCKM